MTPRDDISVEVKPGQTLLVALAEQGVSWPSECRSGFCGACRGQLVRGEPQYESTPVALYGDGDVLPCCATVAAPSMLIIKRI